MTQKQAVYNCSVVSNKFKQNCTDESKLFSSYFTNPILVVVLIVEPVSLTHL